MSSFLFVLLLTSDLLNPNNKFLVHKTFLYHLCSFVHLLESGFICSLTLWQYCEIWKHCIGLKMTLCFYTLITQIKQKNSQHIVVCFEHELLLFLRVWPLCFHRNCCYISVLLDMTSGIKHQNTQCIKWQLINTLCLTEVTKIKIIHKLTVLQTLYTYNVKVFKLLNNYQQCWILLIL